MKNLPVNKNTSWSSNQEEWIVAVSIYEYQIMNESIKSLHYVVSDHFETYFA